MQRTCFTTWNLSYHTGARLGEKSKKVLNHFPISQRCRNAHIPPHIRQFGALPSTPLILQEWLPPADGKTHTAYKHKEYKFKCVGSWFERRQFVTFREVLNNGLWRWAILARCSKTQVPCHIGRSIWAYSQLARKFMEGMLEHSPELWVRGHIWLSRDPCKHGFLSANFETRTSYATLLQHFRISLNYSKEVP